MSDGERQRELRLADVDAPERGQPWGKRATQALVALVSGRELRVELLEFDRHGREVSRVFAGETCVACALVRGGHAWAYRRYLRDPSLLDDEREARAARRGLWSQPADTFVPPWEWRAGVRVAGESSPAQASSCGSKRSCRELSSCAEARFQLERCGQANLDGDGDGIPCETLCSGRE